MLAVRRKSRKAPPARRKRNIPSTFSMAR
jgi:hypothetical protein